MRYYKARALCGGRGWHFTVLRDDDVTPVGYCSGTPILQYMATEAARDDAIGEMYRAELRKLEPHRHKFHDHSHATAEEALACYRQYALDVLFSFSTAKPLDECAECGKVTDGVAMLEGWVRLALCADHQTREFLDKHFDMGTEWASS